jgi:hypothetical protein
LDKYKLGAMTTPAANVTMHPAPGAGATGMVPSGTVSPSAAMAALTPLQAAPSSYVQPLMLTMGGLLQSTYGEFELWMGGRPFMSDWTGLYLMWVMKSKSPNQLDPTSSSGAQKCYNYHQKGLKTSFDRGSDLSVFQTTILKKTLVWTPLCTCHTLRIQRTWSVFSSITQVSHLILFKNMPNVLCHCMISTMIPMTGQQSCASLTLCTQTCQHHREETSQIRLICYHVDDSASDDSVYIG